MVTCLPRTALTPENLYQKGYSQPHTERGWILSFGQEGKSIGAEGEAVKLQSLWEQGTHPLGKMEGSSGRKATGSYPEPDPQLPTMGRNQPKACACIEGAALP